MTASRLMGASILALVAGFAACGGGGGNNTTNGSGGHTSASTSSQGGGTTSATTTSSTGVMAMGDPCRGTALPDGQFFVSSGLCARYVGHAHALRQITFASNGDMFGVAASGEIKLFTDTDKNGVFDDNEIVTWANTGGNGNNCHIDEAGGYLYAGSPDGVVRFPYVPGSMSSGAGEPVVTGQPGDGNHPKHTVHVYDGYLYVHSGSSGNASDPMSPAYDTNRSLLRRFNLATFKSGQPFDWQSGEVYSSGIRNMVGYTKNQSGRMFGVMNGLDDIHYMGADVHQDNPGEPILELGMGKTFGYPFCFTAQRVVVNGQVVAPGTQLRNEDFGSPSNDDAWCAANSSKPATFVQAHSAPLDITFFDAAPIGGLPEKWRGGAFVALHGSWDRSNATGYKVVFVPVDGNGDPQMPSSDTSTTTFPYETVFGGGDSSGPKDGPWNWNDGTNGENVRPVGVAISPIDGALYISSDSGGLVYRVGIQK